VAEASHPGVEPEAAVGFDERDHLRHLQTGAGGRHAILRVAAASNQCADLFGHVRLDPLPGFDDLAGDLEPKHVGGSRRRRIHAAALQHIRTIDARRDDLDQHLTGTRLRHRPLDGHQAAIAVSDHCLHH